MNLHRVKLRKIRSFGHWFFTFSILFSATGSFGQQKRGIAGGSGLSVDVWAPDSSPAMEKLARAREKEGEKEWKAAALLYQDVSTEFGDRVIPVPSTSNDRLYVYYGVSLAIQERLAKWPDDGLQVYNDLYAKKAADLLNSVQAGDTNADSNVFWNYFITDSGKLAGSRLINAYIDRGDFRAAEWIGNRLLYLHPSLQHDKSMIMFRTAVAAHWSGDDARARSLLKQLKSETPNETGLIGGKQTVLADALDAQLDAPPPAAYTDAGSHELISAVGGNDNSVVTERRIAKMEFISLPLAAANKTSSNQGDASNVVGDPSIGIMPVADSGAFYFQDGRTVYAVDAATGSPLPGWASTYSANDGRYSIHVPGPTPVQPLTLTVTPTAVLAILGQTNHAMVIARHARPTLNPSATPAKLVCLDRDTGVELWSKTPAEIPGSAMLSHSAEFTGTPVVVPGGHSQNAPPGLSGDSVLMCVHSVQGDSLEDCSIVCLSAETGQFRWSTYVGGATCSLNANGSSFTPSSMVLYESRLFVMTNLGSVLAIEPATGKILWLNGYGKNGSADRDVARINGRSMHDPRILNETNKAWQFNPLLVSGGSVFALPSDASQIFVFDAETGAELKALPIAVFNNARLLLGVRDGIICVAGDRDVYAADWQKYKPDAAPSDYIAWAEKNFTSESSNMVRGRGFSTDQYIFVPTRYRLYQFSWKDQRIVSVYPSRGQFGPDQGPGNVLATPGNIIICGDRVQIGNWAHSSP
jgi:outer membrane protein assembly factor BamB